MKTSHIEFATTLDKAVILKDLSDKINSEINQNKYDKPKLSDIFNNILELNNITDLKFEDSESTILNKSRLTSINRFEEKNKANSILLIMQPDVDLERKLQTMMDRLYPGVEVLGYEYLVIEHLKDFDESKLIKVDPADAPFQLFD